MKKRRVGFLASWEGDFSCDGFIGFFEVFVGGESVVDEF